MKLVAQSTTILFLVLLISQVSFAEDVAGSSDHPMVSRYGGGGRLLTITTIGDLMSMKYF